MDRSRLVELREEVGDEALAEVIEMSFEETDEVIERLRGGAPAGRALGADLHFLRGAGLNLGLTDLAQACQKGEHLAMAEKDAEVDLPAILALYETSRHALTAMVADLGA